MKTLIKIVAAALTGAVLSLSASAAFADGRGHDRGWDNRHYYGGHRHGHRHHHHHHRHYRGPAVYAPYYAPAPVYYGPPPAVYRPNYYVSRPAVTVGISPIVIPLD